MELELDPHEIRLSLQASREQGHLWEHAWGLATNYRRPANRGDERSLYSFMEKHFRAAYYRSTATEGRWDIPERDVSTAIVKHAEPAPVRDHERCRSADDCKAEATHGTFGRMFCERHFEDLGRIAGMLKMARSKADPRNGGNDSLYSHRTAA